MSCRDLVKVSMPDDSQTPREASSYFWSCFTLSDSCPLISPEDSKLCYFVLSVLSLYLAFILIIGFDLKFFWPIDNFLHQVDYYINLVRRKIHHIQADQRRLESLKDKTEKQLKKSKECCKVIRSLRAALAADNCELFRDLMDSNNNPPIVKSPTESWEIGAQKQRGELNEFALSGSMCEV